MRSSRSNSGTRRSSRTCPPPVVPADPADPVAADRARTLGSLSDATLLSAMGGAGSTAALWELFQRHGAAVHRLGCLFVSNPDEVDRIVEDVFVTLSQRSGRLEDDVENVRLGLMAMAWRRTRSTADVAPRAPVTPAGALRSPNDAVATARLQCLQSGDRDALALTVSAAASLAEVAVVLEADRRVVGARLRTGLCSLGARREPVTP